MTNKAFILAIDQGTTSTRALLFGSDFSLRATAQEEFKQQFPAPGQVEQDPQDLWQTTLRTVRQAMAEGGCKAADIAAIGLTNQRETSLIWERSSGEPVYPAIGWQDRRTAPLCERLREEGHEPDIARRTGLLLDPYFSAAKIAWLLAENPALRRRAEAGELAFGTVDSFLLWHLTGGAAHKTDATNASRTMLYNLGTGQWDDDLLQLFGVPRALLPEVCDSAGDFGQTVPQLFGGAIDICGVVGDQQSAAIGQACLQPGMLKATYGTGCFALLNTGTVAPLSQNRLLTTVACQLGGERSYALEGSIFIAGAAIQWLRDSLGVLSSAAASDAMARASDPEQPVVAVPAFTGLGAPHWDSEARGALFGMTQNTGPNELVRAVLESVCFQTRDLLTAMRQDLRASEAIEDAMEVSVLRVDGGMSANDWTMQFLADMLDAPVDRPQLLETTAFGAACLAAVHAGLLPSLSAVEDVWQCQQRFQPSMDAAVRERKYAAWQEALQRTLTR